MHGSRAADAVRLLCSLPGAVFVVAGDGRILRASVYAAKRYGFAPDAPAADLFGLGIAARARWERLVTRTAVGGRVEWTSRPAAGPDAGRPARFLLEWVTDGDDAHLVLFETSCCCMSARRKPAIRDPFVRGLLADAATVLYRSVDRGSDRVDAYATPNSRRVLGWSYSARGRPFFWSWSVHPDDLLHVLRAIRESGGAPTALDYRFRRRDGRVIVLRDRLKERVLPGGARVRTGSWRDVTAERDALEEATGLGRRVTHLLDQCPVPVEIVDLGGRVVYCNDKLCALLGVSRRERVGRRVWDLQPSRQERERFRSDLQYIIRHRPRPEPYYNREVRKGRGPFQVRSDWNYVLDARGRHVAMVAVLTDLTALERAGEGAPGFSRSLIAAQETERSRIAAELHDGVCQLLAAAKMALPRPAPPAPGREGALDASSLLSESIAEIRRITHELHPLALEDGDFWRVLKDCVDAFSRKTGIRGRFAASGEVPRMTNEARHALYRILQESLENVRRHSRAKNVRVRLTVARDGVRLRVRDDGRGFRAGPASGGVGLLSIRNRAKLLGGEARTGEAKGGGAEVEVFIPVEREGEP
ncbi:MAG: PAS domain-containing protein [Elusimicrobia bacterium]|nr:PAS domain-containing protein [Elusimicrobiota bacterium]